MTGWGSSMMMIFWIVVLLLVAWAVWAFVQRGGAGALGAPREDPAEALLRERFARGEIDEEAYRRMHDELRRDRP
jgi:putative membrane protein